MSMLRLLASAAVLAAMSAGGCDGTGDNPGAGFAKEGRAPGEAGSTGGGDAPARDADAAGAMVPLVLAAPESGVALPGPGSDSGSGPEPGPGTGPVPETEEGARVRLAARGSEAGEPGGDAEDFAALEEHVEEAEEAEAVGIDQLAGEMRELAIMALQTRKKLMNLSVTDPFVEETRTLANVSNEMREIARSSILTRKALLDLRFDESGKATQAEGEGDAEGAPDPSAHPPADPPADLPANAPAGEKAAGGQAPDNTPRKKAEAEDPPK